MSEPLVVHQVALADLHEDPANCRIHSDKSLKVIKDSLLTFTQVEPLVIQRGTGKVIAGNGRLRVMRELKWDRADVVEIDISDVHAAALALALNRTGEASEWDYEAVSKMLVALKAEEFDISKLGWADYELEPLLQADWTPPAVDPDATFESTSKISDATALTLTAEQRVVVDAVIKKIRERDGMAQIDEGVCVVMALQEWLG